MDLKEFAQEFKESAEIAAENGGNDLDLELASSILEYLEDNGEVNVPEICAFKKTRARITAYDFNSEAESLDLFYFIKADTLLGKINNSKVHQGFNYLSVFFREAMDGSLMRTPGIEENDEIVLLENGQVDAGELAREAFILGMDTKTLCSEDCKGLCPRCGADLNVGPCSCKKEVDPRLAVLAKLLENK